jgi:hypothetical protein
MLPGCRCTIVMGLVVVSMPVTVRVRETVPAALFHTSDEVKDMSFSFSVARPYRGLGAYAQNPTLGVVVAACR